MVREAAAREAAAREGAAKEGAASRRRGDATHDVEDDMPMTMSTLHAEQDERETEWTERSVAWRSMSQTPAGTQRRRRRRALVLRRQSRLCAVSRQSSPQTDLRGGRRAC